jgi:tRNA(Ile)-lysidine synthase
VIEVGDWRLTSQQIDRSALSSDWRRNLNRWTAYFDADTVRVPVLITPQPGARIAPLGLTGRRKLVGDLFTDAKIAPALRPGWPVIMDDASRELLWVCGLAQAHIAQIAEETRRALMLTWTRRHT